MKKRNRYIWSVVISIPYLLFTSTTCVRVLRFQNCTGDTLFVCASHYCNIDSVKYVVWGDSPFSDSKPDTLLKNSDFYFESRDVVYPDSTCAIDECALFCGYDTCYFFLIKWSDAKKYSWDEIREQKRYHTWIVARDKNGNYDKNIRYSDDCLGKTRRMFVCEDNIDNV